MVQARAAMLRQTNAPMAIETIEVGPLAPRDGLVRSRAASLCHTDLEAIEGRLAKQLPAVLDHAAAGEVAEVGADVTDLSPWRSCRAVVEPHQPVVSYQRN